MIWASKIFFIKWFEISKCLNRQTCHMRVGDYWKKKIIWRYVMEEEYFICFKSIDKIWWKIIYFKWLIGGSTLHGYMWDSQIILNAFIRKLVATIYMKAFVFTNIDQNLSSNYIFLLMRLLIYRLNSGFS